MTQARAQAGAIRGRDDWVAEAAYRIDLPRGERLPKWADTSGKT